MKRQVVIYFSNTGHTRSVAEKVASATGAMLIELKAQQPYTAADLDWQDTTSRSTLETKDETSRPAFQPLTLTEKTLIQQADVVYLGSPLWWGYVPHIVNTLVETGMLRGKLVWTFCTSGSTPINKAAQRLSEQYPAVNWQEGRRFTTTIDCQEVENWLR